jgi:hypothetical protein
MKYNIFIMWLCILLHRGSFLINSISLLSIYRKGDLYMKYPKAKFLTHILGSLHIAKDRWRRFNFLNSRIHLHKSPILTNIKWNRIHDYNLFHVFNFMMKSIFLEVETIKFQMWIRKNEFVKLESWTHEVEIVKSRSWNFAFVNSVFWKRDSPI